MTQVSGGCTCGAVRITSTGSPYSVGLCHCLDCRKHHGAPFYAAAAFDPAAVSITGRTETHKGRSFCPKCGSSVFASEDGEIEIHLGILDEPNHFTPTYELWTSRRENWLQPITGAKQYPRNRTD